MQKLNNSLLFHETHLKRHENCSMYGNCLMRAAMLNYKSWTCNECDDYDPQVIKVEMYSDEPIMPQSIEKFNTNEINAHLVKKMRGMGISTPVPYSTLASKKRDAEKGKDDQ